MSRRRSAAYGRGQQLRHRHIHKTRIPIVCFAVGKSQLRRLDQQMNVGRRVVSKGSQVIPFEQSQLLQEYRPLRPRTALVHIVATVIDAYRLLISDR